MTPRSPYRDGLERHLDETRGHADRLQQRLAELGQGDNPLQALLGFSEGLLGQVLALSKTPFDLLRGSGGEEKVLKNAKDAAANRGVGDRHLHGASATGRARRRHDDREACRFHPRR